MKRAKSAKAERAPHARRPGRASTGVCALVLALVAVPWGDTRAQTPATPNVRETDVAAAPEAGRDPTDPESDLEVLVARALDVNPRIRAARDRLEAAQAAVGPAGLRPDPMLMAGVSNFPISGGQGFSDFMTMKMLGIGQVFPYPGKLALRRRVAELETAAADARLAAARWAVEEEVKDAYYDLAFADRALEIIHNNQTLLTNFVRVTETRYGVGTGGQQDVLKARVEAARLAEEAVALIERRRAALARLNAALDRPTDTPVETPRVPTRVARAAVADDAGEIRFTSGALGARAEDSPLPPLAALQETAVRANPTLRAHEAMIAAQAARVELARKEHLPDFDFSLQYGQRNDRSDMISAVVTVPIPLQKGRKQDLRVTEARAELSALQEEHHQHVNEIRAAVASAYADLERDRAQLALFVKSIIPQGRASLESATAGFQVGRNDFLTLLENQTTLYTYEMAYYRLLTGFGQRLAELERVAGEEILR